MSGRSTEMSIQTKQFILLIFTFINSVTVHQQLALLAYYHYYDLRTVSDWRNQKVNSINDLHMVSLYKVNNISGMHASEHDTKARIHGREHGKYVGSLIVTVQ